MSLRIGNQTACFAASPCEPFDYALAQGFDAFEWFPDKKPGAGWDESDLNSDARAVIRDSAGARGLRLSVHARWQANLLAPDGYALMLKDLDLARDLGAVLLNIHLAHEQGLAAFVEALRPLLRRTAEAGVQLAIENTPMHAPELFNELFERLRGLELHETSHVGMCLDLGHANLCAATRNDYLAFCDRLNPRVPIIHLHLHENWGDHDAHLPLFTGPAGRDDAGIRGFLERLRRRDFSGSVVLEQWPQPASLLNQARDRLLQLWNAGGEARPEVGVAAPPKSADVRVNGGVAALSRDAATPAPGQAPESAPGSTGAPLDGLAAALIAGNAHARSWREKLDLVHRLLARDPSTSDLVDLAVYLRFLGAGQIPCVEDGRHFRPAHHARTAGQIQGRLARMTAPETAFIVRKIYPWLPSSAPTFQRPEPLTRIRDIAHRNDLPQELKREIKTTLQNKLHRCAGPEDLATSEALLQRLTAPGANYSPAFVEQFQLFHEELKEFFNAQSLDKRLAALAPQASPEQARLAEAFLRQKAATAPRDQLEALRTLTRLRQSFLNTAAHKPAAESQDFLLADIALEDFAFVLLSTLINACERLNGDEACELEGQALLLALRNLALSGIAPGETRAIESELQAWTAAGWAPPRRDELLRLKATALRCRRLTEDFGAHVIALFARRAEALGQGLGVAPHAIRVFCESDIRANLAFQISKLASRGLRRLRHQLGLSAWDVLVAGRVVGRAKTIDSLEQVEALEGPFVVRLKQAAGDEEIPKGVVGIALGHELPHLSHLGVRARQAGVVVAACEEASEFERLQRFEGQHVTFEASPERVVWAPAPASPSQVAGSAARPAPPQLPTAQLMGVTWLPLEQATPQTAGGKGAGARRLAELACQPNAGFRTPASLVIPFGLMEAQLAKAPAVAAEYRQLVKQLDKLAPQEFESAAERLRHLLEQLEVPAALEAAVTRTLAPRPSHPALRLAVRSSANCEDVAGLAGAGLYDSVLNVAPAGVAAAVRRVWSSLWTRRAALSRRQAGIPHEQAHMAVLIQELLNPDLSFVLHTVNPLNQRPRELYAEVVLGLGDTLASASTQGSPYRLSCDKDSGAVTTLAFANFSEASVPDAKGGVRRETLDYSRAELSRDAEARQHLGRRLAAIGRFVEEGLGAPQDIEGAVVGDHIYLVQARPQPGLNTPHAK